MQATLTESLLSVQSSMDDHRDGHARAGAVIADRARAYEAECESRLRAEAADGRRSDWPESKNAW